MPADSALMVLLSSLLDQPSSNKLSKGDQIVGRQPRSSTPPYTSPHHLPPRAYRELALGEPHRRQGTSIRGANHLQANRVKHLFHLSLFRISTLNGQRVIVCSQESTGHSYCERSKSQHTLGPSTVNSLRQSQAKSPSHCQVGNCIFRQVGDGFQSLAYLASGSRLQSLIHVG